MRLKTRLTRRRKGGSLGGRRQDWGHALRVPGVWMNQCNFFVYICEEVSFHEFEQDYSYLACGCTTSYDIAHFNVSG